MQNHVFTSISSDKIIHIIKGAQDRVVLAAPAIFNKVADSIVEAAQLLGKENITIVLDCDEEVFRLGYGDFEAVSRIIEAGLNVRQAPGLRIGIFICDERAWVFSLVAKYVQPEVHSDETPNAIEITGNDIDRILSSLVPEGDSPQALAEKNIEIGNEPVTDTVLQKTNDSLKIAPPVPFDIARQVRVFQPYMQYVEISLKGCSIQRKRVKIPKSIQKLQAKDIEDRLQTTFDLIEKSSAVSSKKLEDDLNQIRDNLTKSLGKPWGRVILKSVRPLFDKRIKEFQECLEDYREKVKDEIEQHLEESKNQVVEYYLPLFEKDPPDALRAGLLYTNPTKDDVRYWLKEELNRKFPKPEDVITDMRLDIQFRDVTYETLCEDGFFEAIQREYSSIDWKKTFEEFNAAKEKE